MVDAKDWREAHEWSAQLLRRQTGEDVEAWNRRIVDTGISTRDELQLWLKARAVHGYAQQLLVMERFGYPEHMIATADELVDSQLADRPKLRPVFEEVIEVALGIALQGQVEVQAREDYVTFRTKRRKFGMVKASTKTRVDLGLRLYGVENDRYVARLQPPKLLRDDTMTHRIPLLKKIDVDDEVCYWMAMAFSQNT